jgi:DNA-binding response OmpR family regulator
MVMDETRVLVIEDDAATASFLADNLEADGYRVAVATAAGEGLRAIEVRRPDVVLLDVGLGDGSGLRVLDVVRAADGVAARIDRDVPVIVVSGRGSEVERLRGFRRGADDYVVKPFSYPELVARMQAVLRRTSTRRLRGALRVCDLEVDPVTRSVMLAGQPVALSAKEFDLVHRLAQEPTRVFRKGELLRDVWGFVAAGATRTVDTHACRVRAKLAGGERPYVQNVRGVGYRLVGEAL